MTESRFCFLEEAFPDLYEKCVQAEQAVECDVAMLRIRQTLEYMVRDLGAQSQDLFQGINELEGRNIINLKISQRFHDVRRMANQAVHGNAVPDKDDIRQGLDNLLLLMVWYGLEKGETYTLEQFSPADVAAVRSYLAAAGQLSKEAAVYDINDNRSVDPLQLAGSFQFSEDELSEQHDLERDVFETQEEYEQRIADMDPVHIGYGILDTRRKDGYTGVNFLVHHVDHNPDIQFSPISAFYTMGVTDDMVIDSELVAKLKVYEGNICCDYSRVYLQHDGELIAAHPIYWETFLYENDDEYKDRIRTMPLLPFGMAMAVRREYDLTTEELPMVINPFQYAEPVLKHFLSEDKRVTIQCNRDMAKKICNVQTPCLLFLKLHTIEAVAKSLLWRTDVGEIVEKEYPKPSDWYQKAAEQGNRQAQASLEKIEAAEETAQLNLAANQGDVQAQNRLGDCYYKGEGVEKDYRKAVEWYRKAADKGYGEAQNNLGSCYYGGHGVELDYQRAVYWYQKGADQGCLGAQNNLGNCYYYGRGVEKSYRKAAEWYRKAADKGEAQAQDNLGDCYYSGAGVEQDSQKAVAWYRKAAEQGYASAQNHLGVCYDGGYGVEQDYQKAASWFQKAADKGYDWAQDNLGKCYYNGEGVEKDYQKAVEWYQKAAEQGNSSAQNNLGDCYYSGEGVVQDYGKAVEWYRKAADKGYDRAQNNLGNCYYNGTGVEKDYGKAVEWYRKAADKGYDRAQNNLGNCYYNGKGVKKDYRKAAAWYGQAAEQGYAWSQNNLGICYYNGTGIKKDYGKAVEWYRKAADRGYDRAQNNLGNCYYSGEGVEKDYQKAVEWYQKAASQGFAAAQDNLGASYYNGDGVEKDYQKAVEWYRKAAEQGYAKAQNHLGVCYDGGDGVEKDYRKAAEWFLKAADKGYVWAQDNLGTSYYNGDGVDKDYQKAVEWYRKAADKGNSSAQNNLGNCYYRGKGVEKDFRKAVEWYQKAAEQGYAAAQNSLAGCHLWGVGTNIDGEKAREWYQKAAAQGYAWGHYNLGRMYHYGYGTDKNREKAIEWYQKAAEQGKNNEELQKSVQEKLAEISKNSGCFITTAVCDSLQKADDCYELTAFRRFRDNWLALQADGSSLIEEYYDIAPKIVEMINAEDNRDEIYRAIWLDYLKPCLALIEDRRYEACKSFYVEMVRKLQHRYLA